MLTVRRQGGIGSPVDEGVVEEDGPQVESVNHPVVWSCQSGQSKAGGEQIHYTTQLMTHLREGERERDNERERERERER